MRRVTKMSFSDDVFMENSDNHQITDISGFETVGFFSCEMVPADGQILSSNATKEKYSF